MNNIIINPSMQQEFILFKGVDPIKGPLLLIVSWMHILYLDEYGHVEHVKLVPLSSDPTVNDRVADGAEYTIVRNV